MTLTCYTDASYSDRFDVAACGYAVYCNDRLVKNTVVLVGGIGGPGRAEAQAISEALQYCFLVNDVSHIEIHTDQIAARSKNRRIRIARFREVNTIIEIAKEYGVEVTIKYVLSHGTDHDPHQVKHNLVDKNCRMQLRKYLKETYEGKSA